MYDEVYKQIGRNIKKYRNTKNITQEALSEKINKSLNFVGKIEVAFASHPSLETLYDISQALDIPFHELFKLDN